MAVSLKLLGGQRSQISVDRRLFLLSVLWKCLQKGFLPKVSSIGKVFCRYEGLLCSLPSRTLGFFKSRFSL